MKSSKFNPPRADQSSNLREKVQPSARSPKEGLNPRRRSNTEEGQSLVEIIVAVGLILTAVVALLSLATSSMKSSGFGVTKARATKLANEEMELVRAYRDSVVWSSFDDLTAAGGVADCSAANHCYIDSGLLSVVFGGNNITTAPFTRYFITDPDGADQSKYRVTVHVTWTDQSGDHDVVMSSVLSDWQ